MTKPNEPEAQKLRDLIAEIAADLSTENPFWTAKLLADALITHGIGIVPAHPVADAGWATADIDHLDALLDCSGDCDKMLAFAAHRLQSVAAATAAKDAEIARLREALREADDAIAEYYRYFTGGELRGSYDGKPERANLWKAGQKARAALSEAREAGG